MRLPLLEGSCPALPDLPSRQPPVQFSFILWSQNLRFPLMMLCSIISQITSLAALRRLIRWREILPLLLGGAAGVPIALYLLMLTDAHIFRISFGVFLAAYALYMFARPASAALAAWERWCPIRWWASQAEFIGGLTAMPGAMPTIWCDLRGISKERQRGMVQPFILVMQIFEL